MQNTIIHEDTDIFCHGYTGPDMLDPDSILHKNGINRSHVTFNDEFAEKINSANKRKHALIGIANKHALLVSKIVTFCSGN